MRIVYCGCGRFGIDSLNALKASDHKLLHIVTQPDKQSGRGRKITANDIAQWAQENNIPFTNTQNINSPESIELIKELKPDLLVVIAFGQKISEEVINIPQKGAINVHGSLLPKYRGAAPVNWAVINGETETGISIITLADKMDCGQILAQDKLQIKDEDNAQNIHDELARLSGGLLIETIDKIDADTATYTKQDDAKATLAPKLKKSDGIINFSDSAVQIHNKVRGLFPWPGTVASFICDQTNKKSPVTIMETKVVATVGQNKNVGVLDENLNVLCGEGTLKILKIKPHGSKIMDFKSFINGRGSGPGDCFITFEEQH
ncbi:MAG: methionyl-tRNA formyltransferase [Sedimentisphaerales bacterium]|nr:methionyl-tRNA formyltransferase [Sedimentisphaerales bacterium]